MKTSTPVLRVRVGPDALTASCAMPVKSQVLAELLQDVLNDAFLMLAIKVEAKQDAPAPDWEYWAHVPCLSPTMRKRNLEILVRYARGVGFEVKLDVELDRAIDPREA